MQTERRGHVRYIPRENAFAALGKNFTKAGKIKDISLDGLCFEYIVGPQTSSADTPSVEIFLIDKSFHIHDLPCRVIYDIQVHAPPVGGQSERVLATWRCGLSLIFGTDIQKQEMIRVFLKDYVLGSPIKRTT